MGKECHSYPKKKKDIPNGTFIYFDVFLNRYMYVNVDTFKCSPWTILRCRSELIFFFYRNHFILPFKVLIYRFIFRGLLTVILYYELPFCDLCKVYFILCPVFLHRNITVLNWNKTLRIIYINILFCLIRFIKFCSFLLILNVVRTETFLVIPPANVLYTFFSYKSN